MPGLVAALRVHVRPPQLDYNLLKRTVGSTLGDILVQHRFPQLSMGLVKAFLQKHETRWDALSREVLSCSQGPSKRNIKRRAEELPSLHFCSFRDASWLKNYFLFLSICVEVSASIFQIQGDASWKPKETFNVGSYGYAF